jgi:hypothetical protein
MPYKILKKDSGYKVCKKNSPKCFSKKPIPRTRAEKQMKALYAAESNSSTFQFKSVISSLLSE